MTTTGIRSVAVLASFAMLAVGCTSGEPPAPTGPLIGTSPSATSTPATTGATTTPPGDDSCGPDDVTVEAGEIQAAASSRSTTLLVRPSSTDCPVTNPVTVELLGADANALPSRVEAGVLPEGRTALDTIPAGIGASIRIEWRVVPGGPDADPAVDCVTADSIAITLSAGARPLPVDIGLTACEGGTLFVTPADVNAG